MISFIKGKLISFSPAHVVIETNGIGYKILTPTNLFPHLPNIQQDVTLYTSFVVRELSHTLFGFLSEQERDLFEVLMGVSGIGPKTALSIIGHLPTKELCKAVQENDIKRICKVPGIGSKSAERLILEIRDKLPALFAIGASTFSMEIVIDPKEQVIQDAMSALINLGYTQIAAQKAIKKTLKDAPDSMDLAELITTSLKNV